MMSAAQELLLSLLRSKNRCVEKYLALSDDFLASLTSPGALELLSDFERNRDSILRAIDLYNTKINEAATLLPSTEKTPDLVEAVRLALEAKDSMIARVVEVDEKIIRAIEEAKSAVRQELSSARKSKDLLGKFKSEPGSGSGQGLDEKV